KIKSHFRQTLLALVVDPQRDQPVRKKTPNQKLQRKVVDLLGAGIAARLPSTGPLVIHSIPRRPSQGCEVVQRRSRTGMLPLCVLEVLNKRLNKCLFIKAKVTHAER